MSLFLNKIVVAGNLTRDPELKALPSGAQVVNFAIAVNKKWKDKNTGQDMEKVEFINCIAFQKRAETIAKFFQKGKAIYVEGEMQTRDWTDQQSGKKMYRTEVLVNNFQFVGNKADSQQQTQYQSQQTAQPQQNQQPPQQTQPQQHAPIQQQRPPQQPPAQNLDTIQYPEDSINPDDIPF